MKRKVPTSRLDPDFEIFVRKIARACEEFGWSIILPGKPDDDVNIMVIGQMPDLEQFDAYYFHGNEDDEIETQIWTFPDQVEK